MATKAKGNGKTRQERVQVVFKVAPAVKDLLARMAKQADVSMNRAAESRLATGRWPAKSKERS